MSKASWKTCLKPSDDRTSRLMQQVRDQVFEKKVKSISKACCKPARTCRKLGCKASRKPGLQLARITECGLYWAILAPCFKTFHKRKSASKWRFLTSYLCTINCWYWTRFVGVIWQCNVSSFFRHIVYYYLISCSSSQGLFYILAAGKPVRISEK